MRLRQLGAGLPGVVRGEFSVLMFDMHGAGLGLDEARADAGELWPERLDEGRQVVRTPLAHEDPTPDLIQALARQLAGAHGEDPDAQPHPLRFPRWRFYCARAKVLLAISPAEHRALAAALEGDAPLRPGFTGGAAPHT